MTFRSLRRCGVGELAGRINKLYQVMKEEDSIHAGVLTLQLL